MHQTDRVKGGRRNSRGSYVWLVGPDGAGKSTVASGIDPGTTEVVYWRAGVLPMARQIVGKPVEAGVNSQPHDREPDSSVRAMARLTYYAIDNALGYWFRVRPALRRGSNVLVDRGWIDMVVDPRRYGFSSGRPARMIMRLLPAPDAVVLTKVSPQTAHSRKPELPLEEIARQYAQWANLGAGMRNFHVIDNEQPSTDAVAAFNELLDRLRAS
jgi:thymidylate kinase